MYSTKDQVVWNSMPCPCLESSSVRGTCHGVWLIYPVTFHNLVLLIHDDNTNFFKEDTFQAIRLKITCKKPCPGGETCRGAPAVLQVDPLYRSSSLTSLTDSPGSSVPGPRAYHRKSLPSLHSSSTFLPPRGWYASCCSSSCSFCVLVVLSEVELHSQRGCWLWGRN